MSEQLGKIDALKLKCINKLVTISDSSLTITDKVPFSEINIDEIIANSESALTFKLFTINNVTKEPFLRETIIIDPPKKKITQSDSKLSEQPTTFKPQNMSEPSNNILNLVIQQKDRDLDRAQRMHDILVDEVRKLKEKLEEERLANTKLQVLVETASREKELALMISDAKNKTSLGGITTDLTKPETLSGLAQLVSALKGTSSNSSNSDEGFFPAGYPENKKLAFLEIKKKFDLLDEETVIKLATLIYNFTKDDVDDAYRKGTEKIKNNLN